MAKLVITPKIEAQMRWLSENQSTEVAAIGVLNAKEFRLDDILICEQEAGVASVDISTRWLADEQIRLLGLGIEPWQTSVWIHTHPQGVKGPSRTDEETMKKCFGERQAAVMLILPKKGEWWGCLEFDAVLPWGTQRYRENLEVKVDWTLGLPNISVEEIKAELEAKLTVETPRITAGLGLGWDWKSDFLKGTQEKAKSKSGTKKQEKILDYSEDLWNNYDLEVDDYIMWCDQQNMDPLDPSSYEMIYGCAPNPDFWEELCEELGVEAEYE